jgi:hypothetical protein
MTETTEAFLTKRSQSTPSFTRNVTESCGERHAPLPPAHAIACGPPLPFVRNAHALSRWCCLEVRPTQPRRHASGNVFSRRPLGTCTGYPTEFSRHSVGSLTSGRYYEGDYCSCLLFRCTGTGSRGFSIVIAGWRASVSNWLSCCAGGAAADRVTLPTIA